MTIKTFYDMIYAMLDSNNVLFLFCFMSFVILIVESVLLWRKEKNTEIMIKLIPVMLVMILVGGMACYGIFVKKDLTLWLARYFVVIYPCLVIVMASMIERSVSRIRRYIGESDNLNKIFLYAVPIMLFICLGVPSMAECYDYMQNSRNGQNYRNAANWLYDYNQGEVYLDNVAVAYLRTVAANEGKGWYEYYITKQGQRDELNFISRTMELTYDDFEAFYEQYDTVFVCTMPFSLDAREREWINWIKANYVLTELNESHCIYIFRKEANVLE